MATLSDKASQATPVRTDSPKKPPPFMRFPTSESRESWLSQQRLSMAPQSRFIIGTTAATLVGMTLGVSQGAMMTGLRFRAENAHRLPASQTGWYLYHKSKNYHMMLGGLKEGLGMGLTQGVLVGAFIVLEEAVDQFRGGKRDFGSTVVAALGASGAFSLWNRFPLATAARTAKTSLVVGLGYGLLQDLLSLARGRRLGYVDFVRGLPARWGGSKGAADTWR